MERLGRLYFANSTWPGSPLRLVILLWLIVLVALFRYGHRPGAHFEHEGVAVNTGQTRAQLGTEVRVSWRTWAIRKWR